ncbi:MAG: tetratricopeptide repeat protein [Methylophilaceae bacterium]
MNQNQQTVQAQYQQALGFHKVGQLAQAEALYRELLDNHPQHADSLHLLGVLCHQTARHIEAIEKIGAALQLAPKNPDYLNNYGLALRAAGRLDEAIQCYQRALQISPDDPDLLTNLSNLNVSLNRFDEAIECYRRILKHYPQDADTREALCYALGKAGNQQQLAGLYAKAEASYLEACKLKPSDAALYYNLGNAQRELGKPKDAEISYRKALKLSPGDADIHNNLGNVLRELGQLDAAIASYQTAFTLNPALYHAKVHLVHQKQHICDWQGLDDDIRQIRHWVNTQPTAQISPFAFLAMPSTTPEEQRLCADQWAENRLSTMLKLKESLNFKHVYTGDKLRIGYLSADFRLHPLASLTSEMIELHDKRKIESFAYSYGINDNSAERQRLAKAFDHFVDIRALSQQAAAEKIHADQIDILVDLTGFTQSSRTSLVALRPAPTNVSWLGFPGTMGSLAGSPLFDYLISDGFITPPSFTSNSESTGYAEKLALLPTCYQANDSKRPVAATPTRQQAGLPADAFVYCCFNQSFKILPEVFNVWMRLLQKVPDSVLWLLECNPLAKANLKREAAARGVKAERLIFAPRIAMAQHLARQALADLFLDTLPYNAHTTASDALWMGLPVLTCAGESFASRVAGSLLHAADLPELVTINLIDYEEKALMLATNPDQLGTIKKKLGIKNRELALFNTAKFTRDIEQLYQDIWQNYSQQK